jgi:2-keto-3-deoxy-6-phosphogluconate aldolase
MPTLTWQTPAAISYGTPLSSDQLNASASVAGKFTYIPAPGAVLAAGTHKPLVTFVPTDTANYNAVRASVPLTVTKATPTIQWPAPSAMVYGDALSATQLNATASIKGVFAYTPSAGEILAVGAHKLSVTFTPTDSTDCETVQAEVEVSVTTAKPTTVSWPAPAAITHGTALSDAQLNATAMVPGEFAYTPAAGEVLPVGTHTLTVHFTPADANFPSTENTVQLTVTKAIPAISWAAPEAISYGTALSSVQLNATASVPGEFVYSPAEGERLNAGRHQLAVTFLPADSAEMATAQAEVPLTVMKAKPIVTWQAPAAISYGTALSDVQLNATSLVDGEFFFTPAAGTVLATGKQTLSVTFVPSDSLNYAMAQATVSIVVEGLDNIDSLIPAAGVDENSTGRADSQQGELQDGNNIEEQSQPETRIYKGATYVKGADGQWHLQKK